MQLQTPADQLIYSTLRLTALANGLTLRNGTAFYFQFRHVNGSGVPFLITNKHVVQGADAVQLRLHMRDPNGSFMDQGYPFHLDLGNGVIYHPDPSVDLCVIPPGNMVDITVGNSKTFAVALSEENIPNNQMWDSFDSVEGVWMIGCPNGIYDIINNLPIVRSGITATSPRTMYMGRHEFVVDMACFPESSGSPIFKAPSHFRFNRKTGGFDMGADLRGYLLGVLHAGPMITNSGDITLSSRPQVQVSTMMHLGYAIKSTRILEFKPLVNKSLQAQGLGNLR